MPAPANLAAIEERWKHHFGFDHPLSATAVGGGCINECYRLTFGDKQAFCKINSARKFPALFEKEKNGLELIARSKMIRVPAVIDLFQTDSEQVLLLEWIREGERTEQFWQIFGQQMASLHQVKGRLFGGEDSNYMGNVVQQNEQRTNWPEFFMSQRLEPLANMCLGKNLLPATDKIRLEHLYSKLHDIFGKADPVLVHGDLWSGNFMCNENEEPVLIDPACYFGHPSVDLGMTTLFGGFRPKFYEAYQYYQPLPSNYQEQWQISNLYPLLIHLLLFGSSYLQQIRQTLDRFS